MLPGRPLVVACPDRSPGRRPRRATHDIDCFVRGARGCPSAASPKAVSCFFGPCATSIRTPKEFRSLADRLFYPRSMRDRLQGHHHLGDGRRDRLQGRGSPLEGRQGRFLLVHRRVPRRRFWFPSIDRFFSPIISWICKFASSPQPTMPTDVVLSTSSYCTCSCMLIPRLLLCCMAMHACFALCMLMPSSDGQPSMPACMLSLSLLLVMRVFCCY